MSLRKKSSSRSGLYSSAGGFSSMSLGSYPSTKASGGPYLGSAYRPITPVVINKTLLAPLNLDIDPTVQAVRTHEKDQIKGLNNRFASFIDKVRFLEQQNKMLETKWTLLQEQTTASSDIEPMMKAYISNLQRQLDLLRNDKSRLDQENHSIHMSVEDFKTKYEEEIHRRNGAENEFVKLKRDVDAGYLCKVDLEDKVTSLVDEINFLRRLYDMELCELQESMKDTSVVVQMDNSRDLNMDRIVSEVKAQYEDIAARSRTEAESWYKVKFDQMAVTADQHSSELSETKLEIAQLKGLISRLLNEIHSVKAQRSLVEEQISEAEARGQNAVKDATARVRDLEVALQRAKHDMARQLREYQDLMNIKLALDIEISTYRKLLEGEEDRIGYQSIISIQSVPNNGPVMKRQPQQEPLWFCPAVPKKEEPKVTTCYSTARPVLKLKEPELIACHLPARPVLKPKPQLIALPAPKPVLKLEEPELIVPEFEEPEVPICYFPAPSSPVMKRPETPPVRCHSPLE